ncbi:MAG: metallophosphoesterase [Clostridia bacterium]|nr:metallophosphoesterase [Clostridia bacterium]
MKLGLFSDPHYSEKESACVTRRPSLSYGKIRDAMDAFTAAGCDLVLCLGDLVDCCDTIEEDRRRIDELNGMISSYPMPFYSLMGNHDYQNFTREEFSRRTSYPPFFLRFGDITLIFPDANFMDNGTADGQIYAKDAIDWTNAYLPADVCEKLRAVLADEETVRAYVFLHQNLDPAVEEHHVIRNADAVRAVLRESGKVCAVYQGHFHPGHESIIDGIPYVTLPAMCEGDANPYRIVEI